ncbi:MAG: aminotransferase class III-fold pyridoxal phosphate-dependent enzyme, partial [Acidimicrobiia bacterium]
MSATTSLVTESLIDRERAVVMQTYARQPVAFASGDGCWLVDADGKRYLDCLGGLAVVSVGHANPRVAAAVREQMMRLVHVSNLYFTEPMVTLAERLSHLSGLSRVFFCNDGATANEAAIKLARRYGQTHRGVGCFKVVSLLDSFHGRTLATLA